MAPAIVLDGRITSMVGPDVIAIVADADFVLSVSLVATIEMAFGDCRKPLDQRRQIGMFAGLHETEMPLG